MGYTIENFFQFNGDGKTKAGLSVKTDDGLYFDCKLVEGGSNGYFVVSNQSRAYDNKDGGKNYVNAFGALRGTPAADMFDAVAKEAAGMLKGNDGSQSGDPVDDTDIPF